MAHRILFSLLRRSEMIPHFHHKPQRVGWTLPQYAGHPCHRSQRTLHIGTPLMMKLLSVDELFASRSVQEYLVRTEKDYDECLRVVSGYVSEDEIKEDEMKTQQTKVSLLAPLIQSIRELHAKQKEITETEMLLKDEDAELRKLAEMEREGFLEDIQGLKRKILGLLIPEEEAEMSDLVLEITAGVGGQEAMLFTAEIFEMYQNFAQHQGWSFEILVHMKNDLGGLRHASASISGPQSYKKMKFESGIHRVQRVPKTESKGRVHTSTMSVVVLPQPTEISFTLNPKDLKIETTRASGPGGQHVNKTESAVRIVHLPTGLAAECQQERSQLINKQRAMQNLRAKIYNMMLEKETSKRANQRKIQIGTKDRSEKIRTYNFTQDRVTDHRIGMTVYNVKSFLLGEDLLDKMNFSLQEFSNQEAIMELLKKYSQGGS